ncbi:DUF1566 domain-containing protein [Flavobacterium crassostreae]|uniref:DUF1566 domain-containing protein n=1 Tax=Flavobacterium crassostreae TaxID=1763534 RepID=A0A1B9E9Z7_9FLAO|nr:DUF1566 domain-containing protein [Flavobacterium crassostreae]OCB78763.1 hypothetical protein LPBF_01860 [Flavobacterium crassostreae]
MKKFYTLLAGILVTASMFAQAPKKMSYQAVLRNSSNELITSTSVGMRISVLQGSATGTAIYTETQTTNTNINGLVSLEIGAGTPVTGTFAGINWAAGPYFIKTETDPVGGTSYNISGTSQLLSVPYALFSANSNVGGFTHYLGEAFNGGIIYDLHRGSDGLEHGLIVSLTESTATWQTIETVTNATRSWDGVYNTNLMTNSPAATYIASLGKGWYLPSIDELGKLYYNRLYVNRALFNGGNTLLSNTAYYWSSTEASDSNAYFFYFNDAHAFKTYKSNTNIVRGIKAF